MSWRNWRTPSLRLPRQVFITRGPALAVVRLLVLPSIIAAVGAYVVLQRPFHAAGTSSTTHDGSSPKADARWIYGRKDARFTIIEYADLECPYCRSYFPVLQHLIDEHPEINLQWHHLPLSIHEPAATQAARLAECAGRTGGSAAFWKTVEWIYQGSRGDGARLPPDAGGPGISSSVERCLTTAEPDRIIKAQADGAAREHIEATPTLRVIDHQSGRTLTLRGLLEGDALLSAIDWLTASQSEQPSSDEPDR